ncbi:hypothetical protein JOF53_002875 [Crossiella equi]|uniref:PPM-type phosphatase domain-containing protein n=1 Tax=Crossiella equi TaxID=130796 RepID=A0ABS5ABN9_9PSEU|nr:protein phosphatase 2C domain-containing protein [Crossiella equi]MBP2474003.1 hypothetical protein [Crossiella equi]
MQVTMATEPAQSHQDNEDFVGAVPGAVVLLDGAGSAGADSGCLHGVAWYSRQLGTRLLERLLSPDAGDLREVLGEAISAVAGMHGSACQLDHPGTPSATVLLVRVRGGQVEYLLLADSTLVIESPTGNTAVTDDREAQVGARYRQEMDAMPNGSEEHALALRRYIEAMRNHRNRPDGFWVASTDPDAATEAVTGSVPADEVRSLALLSDGATRLVDSFALADWDAVVRTLRQDGPGELIRQTREAERSDPDGRRWPRGKAFDDATAALVVFS